MTFQGLRDDLLAAETKGQHLFLGKDKYFIRHFFFFKYSEPIKRCSFRAGDTDTYDVQNPS